MSPEHRTASRKFHYSKFLIQITLKMGYIRNLKVKPVSVKMS